MQSKGHEPQALNGPTNVTEGTLPGVLPGIPKPTFCTLSY
jgi:hypothetical protein